MKIVKAVILGLIALVGAHYIGLNDNYSLFIAFVVSVLVLKMNDSKGLNHL